MEDYILGILGGMGPEATSYFFQQLIKATPAQKDGDHIKTIVYSNPQIPDRTQAILGEGISPIEELKSTALKLQTLGVNAIFMPCVTAHYFADQLEENLEVPILHLLKIVHEYIAVNYSDVRKIGILCTTGTRKSGIFTKEFEEYDVVYPDDDHQENEVMEAIYGQKGIKAGFTTGYPSIQLAKAAEHLKENGAEIIIMGCTEIPLAFEEDHIDIPALNIMKIAAEHIVKCAKEEPAMSASM